MVLMVFALVVVMVISVVVKSIYVFVLVVVVMLVVIVLVIVLAIMMVFVAMVMLGVVTLVSLVVSPTVVVFLMASIQLSISTPQTHHCRSLFMGPGSRTESIHRTREVQLPHEPNPANHQSRTS